MSSREFFPKRTNEFVFSTMHRVFVRFWKKLKTQKRHFEINWPLALKNINYKASIIGILIMLALKDINYKASVIGILIMLSLKNINYKTSIIGILIMLALKNINYKASIIGILIMLALNNIYVLINLSTSIGNLVKSCRYFTSNLKFVLVKNLKFLNQKFSMRLF